jgi:POLQ-like helicase
LGKHEKMRFFPSVDFRRAKVEYNDIAIYLALKLNHNGGVAIFCGRKDIADVVLRRIAEIEDRGIDISSFEHYAVDNEHEKIARLIKENYGQDNIYYETAMKGIFAHHRGISNGVRIATEYAMKENLIRCIVCTSTLAQGVNLPIRYLIITNLYQAQERIKVRDFHNLIGRAGRAGLYTEGTILLSETFVYSRRKISEDRWRWDGYLEMLDSDNSESCLSQFLLLVRPKPFEMAYGNTKIYDFYQLALTRYNDNDESYEDGVAALIDDFKKKYPQKLHAFIGTIDRVNRCLDAIESYLLSFLTENNDYDLNSLVSSTFGYFLANEKEKERMKPIFVQDLVAGSTIESVFALVAGELLPFRNKQGKYLRLTISDKTGTITATVWDNAEDAYEQIADSKFVWISGTTSTYNGKLTINVNLWNQLTERIYRWCI